jgi:hypothetical protein
MADRHFYFFYSAIALHVTARATADFNPPVRWK